ncbi:hypothetical protein PBAL39_07645 [Pedobacter sp. BAL39]|uniref:DUF1810 domain-containing protein n=1 Tax=Pedobacter sp. BAL39 TaxID=391596 RepID=UPI0001559F65|nr:DUF1810 domain-containing protein [Pedobacter sp. BAL39]EDM35543.1 hypothetical protein PBAL39_07645 [Pedobacter sp. BAL39]
MTPIGQGTNMENNLNRFITAQEKDFLIALTEIEYGKKQSHWMWYIFPQIQGLGSTETSKHYAIANLEEARQYLKHDLLGPRLIQISKALLKLEESDATKILGSPDDLKLKSSMTLFAAVENADPVFEAVLKKFFNGEKDSKTLGLLQS